MGRCPRSSTQLDGSAWAWLSQLQARWLSRSGRTLHLVLSRLFSMAVCSQESPDCRRWLPLIAAELAARLAGATCFCSPVPSLGDSPAAFYVKSLAVCISMLIVPSRTGGEQNKRWVVCDASWAGKRQAGARPRNARDERFRTGFGQVCRRRAASCCAWQKVALVAIGTGFLEPL
jgi:hypothetical protein